MLRRARFFAFLGLALVAFACAPSGEDDDVAADAVSEADATGVLDLHLFDVWAQPLDARTLTVTRGGRPVRVVPTEDRARVRILLDGHGSYAVHLAAPDHVPLDLALDVDGDALTPHDASVAPDGGRAGVSVAHGRAKVAGRTLASHDVFLGLRHGWFSAQARPARRGNAVSLLMDGEEAWGAVAARLREAQRSVLLSTWWWDSSFELVRDRPLASASERKKSTILATLDASPAQKRILVGQLLGSVSLVDWMTSDMALRSRTNDPLLQFMREGNDTRGKFRFEMEPFRFGDRVVASGALADAAALASEAEIPSTVPGHDVDLTTFLEGMDLASMHQKFVVVDDTTAFVGGMNLRETDWDTSAHEPSDARRLPFDATPAQRDAAANRICPPGPDGTPALTCDPQKPGPRKDYILRIDGPAVADVADVFVKRWNGLVDHGAADAAGRTRLQGIPLPGEAGTVPVQITTTMPFQEHGIAETWFNAIRNAERFVYVEDQFFRVPMLHEAIARRMDEKPDLRLVVVTKPTSRLDPGCAPTKSAFAFFQDRWPDRFLYVGMKSFDPAFGRYGGYVEVDVHAKMLVVDDVFMSVGSANKNNRGLVYEMEMNAAVVDRAFVTAARRRMVRALVPDIEDTDDAASWFEQMRGAAEQNGRIFHDNQDVNRPVTAPRGFLHPLAMPTSCAFPGVGPDAT